MASPGANNSGAKFVGRNRAPRVQIEYEVDVNGAMRKVRLPFVVGVMADLSGTRTEANMPVPPAERDFIDIDAHNFNKRMGKINPRAKFTVPNMVTGGSDMEVDIDFKSMDDFSPDKVAEKIGMLKGLLEARRKLESLRAYLDGRTGAEDLIQKALANDAMLNRMISAGSAGQDSGTGTSAKSAQSSEPSPAQE